jgi:23S rRNA (guanine2445-N2)-methyltransferase
MNKTHLFISCLPGLEEVLGQEVTGLGYSFAKGRAGVFVPFIGMNQIYKLNLHLRTASRVLLPLGRFRCRDKNDLYKGALAINWLPFFKDMPTFAIDSFVLHPTLTNSLYAAQVVKDAICDQLKGSTGSRPSVDTSHPELGLHLYIVDDDATISFDTSNPPLHQRGYRVEGGMAPLRENLAASLLMLAGYTAEDTIVDPCCGSGTFLIEAAMIASKTAPGIYRKSFGFFRHPEFSMDEWEALRQEALANTVRLEPGKFFGIEESVKAYSILKRAIHQSKFDRWIAVSNADFRTMSLPFEPTFVIANPPYGVRLNEIEELSHLYSDLGDFLKQKTKKPAKGAIFTGSLDLAKAVGLKTTKRYVLSNGGIDCRLLTYDLY